MYTTNTLKLLEKPDWKLIRDNLEKEGRLEKKDFIRLINDCNKIFSNNPPKIMPTQWLPPPFPIKSKESESNLL